MKDKTVEPEMAAVIPEGPDAHGRFSSIKAECAWLDRNLQKFIEQMDVYYSKPDERLFAGWTDNRELHRYEHKERGVWIQNEVQNHRRIRYGMGDRHVLFGLHFGILRGIVPSETITLFRKARWSDGSLVEFSDGMLKQIAEDYMSAGKFWNKIVEIFIEDVSPDILE